MDATQKYACQGNLNIEMKGQRPSLYTSFIVREVMIVYLSEEPPPLGYPLVQSYDWFVPPPYDTQTFSICRLRRDSLQRLVVESVFLKS